MQTSSGYTVFFIFIIIIFLYFIDWSWVLGLLCEFLHFPAHFLLENLHTTAVMHTMEF